MTKKSLLLSLVKNSMPTVLLALALPLTSFAASSNAASQDGSTALLAGSYCHHEPGSSSTVVFDGKGSVTTYTRSLPGKQYTSCGCYGIYCSDTYSGSYTVNTQNNTFQFSVSGGPEGSFNINSTYTPSSGVITEFNVPTGAGNVMAGAYKRQ